VVVLAPADCPTQLLTQYRRRWGVSRPCSGRERVGPPRQSHQDHHLVRSSLAASRGQLSKPIPRGGQGGEHARTQARSVRRGVSRSCRPGVVHETEQ
jgi:hypothetical protein